MVFTPIEFSTSSSRLTSSIRATLRSVVRPLFSRLAHSSATPAFLLDFTSIDPDSLASTDDTEVDRTATERDNFGVECLADPGEHLESEVLMTLFDPVHRTLAGAQHVGELGLRPAAVLAGVPDEIADPAQVVISHAPDLISHVRYRFTDPPVPA